MGIEGFHVGGVVEIHPILLSLKGSWARVVEGAEVMFMFALW